MDNQPILSLCIPTNGAVQWVLPVLDSIYNQKCDQSKFEVVITDNGKDSLLPEYIAKMEYPNLRYHQTTDDGFLNLVTCLKEGKGLFCKMINHRSVLLPNSILKFIDLIEKYKETQPVIYCPSGSSSVKGIVECNDLDEFVNSLSYWCSWSAGIGFWQKDIPNFEGIILDDMFPNASLLFEVRKSSKYVIWNEPYMKMEDDSGKGGYDLFQTFGVRFLDLINVLRIHKRITQETFIKVKRDIYGFLSSLYVSEVLLPTKHTFIIGDVRQSMNVYFGRLYYWKMVIGAWLRVPIAIVRKCVSSIFRVFE